MDDLMFYNPDLDLDLDDEEEVGLELAEFEAPKRRRRKRKNPEPIAAVAATPVLLLGAAYLAWVWYNQTRFKVWNWQPWQLAGLTKPRLQLRQTNNAQAEEERRRASLHEAIDKMMKPSVYTVEEMDTWKKPTYRPVTEEIVSFIYP